MDNYILFVFEGEKTEKQVFESLKKYFLNEMEHTQICCYFCGEIYSLYHTMTGDSDLDIISILKEKDINKGVLSDVPRNSVSEVYLFFDYDGHAPCASDAMLKDMLDYFDEETENGKLYISYPMVEALKHINNQVPFHTVKAITQNNSSYKGLVHNNCDVSYRDITQLTREHWSTILSEHCKKLNYLMTDEFSLPTRISTQMEVFEKQEEKHISPNSEVAVLSAFPVLIADYYGCSKLNVLIG